MLGFFTGFRRGAETRAARASGEAAEASLVDARYRQALTTTNQFFDALSARQLLAVRENDIAAESVGVDTTRYKVTAFVLAASLLFLLPTTITGGIGWYVASTAIAGVGYGISFSVVADTAVGAVPARPRGDRLAAERLAVALQQLIGKGAPAAENSHRTARG